MSTEQQAIEKIAFIGLGLMGSRMADRLIESEYKLIVHNRTKEKAQPLIQKGAIWADSPRQAAVDADVVFSMLSTPEVVAMMAFGELGFLTAMKPGSIWINCSSVDPFFAKACGAAAGQAGVGYIDAPVIGGVLRAEKGELLVYAAGADFDIKRCESCLSAIGKETIVLNKHGLGSVMKMAYSMLRGTAMAAFGEALNFGTALGMDKDQLMDALLSSDMATPFLHRKRDSILAGDFEPRFPLRWMHKDLFLTSITAYDANVPIPMVHSAKEVYARARSNGDGELDYSAICKAKS